MASLREVAEGRLEQGEDEEITYTLDVSAQGSSPSNVAVEAKAWPAGTDVKSTVMPSGSASVNGNVITLPELTALTAGTLYRIEVQYTIGGNVLETWFEVQATE